MRRSALVAVAAAMVVVIPFPLLWPEPQAPEPTPLKNSPGIHPGITQEFTAAEQPADKPAAAETAIAPDKDQSRIEATTAPQHGRKPIACRSRIVRSIRCRQSGI